MNCQEFHDRLLDLVAGRITPPATAPLLEHAASCPDCESVLALEEALQLERDEGDVERVPEEWVAEMWPAVQARMGGVARPVAPLPTPAWARRALAAAAALALFGSGYLLGGHRVAGEPSVSEQIPPVARTPETGADALLATFERVPDDTTLMSSTEVEDLLDESPRLRRWVARLQRHVDPSDGIQAGELRDALGEGATALPASWDSREIRRFLRRRV